MPVDKLYHILCTASEKVIYEGRFQCATRTHAIKLLKDKIGRNNLAGLVFTITEIPIDIIRDIIIATLENKPIPTGDIVAFSGIESAEAKPYASITSYKRNPHKPHGIAGIKRRLGS